MLSKKIVNPESLYSFQFLIIFFGLITFFMGWKTLDLGQMESLSSLMNIFNFAQSLGLLLVGLPVILLLLFSKSEQDAHPLHLLGFLLQGLALVFSAVFIYNSNNSGYFGFEQIPADGKVFWLAAFLTSILASLFFCLGFLSSSGKVSFSQRLGSFFILITIGTAFALLALQSLSSISMNPAELLIPLRFLSQLLMQLLSVAALTSTYAILFNQRPATLGRAGFQKSLLVLASLLLICGGISTQLGVSGHIQVALSQFLSGTGYILFIALALSELMRKALLEKTSFLAGTLWPGYFTLFLVLVFAAISNVGPISAVFSTGLFLSAQKISIILIIPTLFLAGLAYQATTHDIIAIFARAFLACGLFVTLSSIVILSPYGASFSQSLNPAFSSGLAFVLSGIFLVIGSFLLMGWNRFLGFISKC